MLRKMPGKDWCAGCYRMSEDRVLEKIEGFYEKPVDGRILMWYSLQVT
ncbi:MAG: hypothetical protein IJ147_00815 [Lachnospiraceae bacterium]|nr:hypothetical protein [Lachnospiraceae bacterium]